MISLSDLVKYCVSPGGYSPNLLICPADLNTFGYTKQIKITLSISILFKKTRQAKFTFFTYPLVFQDIFRSEMVLTKQMVHKVLLFMPESSGWAWALPHSLDPSSKSAQVKGSYWKSCTVIVEGCLSRKHTEKSNHPSGFQLCWNMCAGAGCVHTMRVCVPASFWPLLKEPVEEALPMLSTEIVIMIAKHPLSIIGEWH